MTRDRPETVLPQNLTFQAWSHTLYGKTQHFLHPLSLQNAFCTRLPSKMHVEDHQTRQFCETSSKSVTGRPDPTRHESAIYIAGTTLKLQNTLKFQRQLIHQQHLQSHLQCRNHPGVAKRNGIPSTEHTPETGENSSYNGGTIRA